jgi:hypothetical protein
MWDTVTESPDSDNGKTSGFAIPLQGQESGIRTNWQCLGRCRKVQACYTHTPHVTSLHFMYGTSVTGKLNEVKTSGCEFIVIDL